jgi:hypothetical protein
VLRRIALGRDRARRELDDIGDTARVELLALRSGT